LAIVLCEERQLAEHEIGAVETELIPFTGRLSIKFIVAGTVEDGVLVILFPAQLGAPDESVIALRPGPVMQKLFAGAVKANPWIRIEPSPAVAHRNRYIVGRSIDVPPKIPVGLWEIALRPAYRMRAGELSVSDHPGAEDKVMRQRGILRVLKPAGPRGVNIVR